MSITWQMALDRLHHSGVDDAKRWGMSDEEASVSDVVPEMVANPTREQIARSVPPIVDRVAEALFEAEAAIYDFKIAWYDVGDYRRFCYRQKAHAAISAMREPTVAMADAGRWPGEDGEPMEAWRAMVDAALTDTQQKGSETP